MENWQAIFFEISIGKKNDKAGIKEQCNKDTVNYSGDLNGPCSISNPCEQADDDFFHDKVDGNNDERNGAGQS